MSPPAGLDTEEPPAYLVDGRPVDERAFYAAACDPARSVLVEACAGAGKTWMLVSRILRALLAGTPPQQILAVTFTRRAAGEMRERLDHWLAGFAAGCVDDATRCRELEMRGVAPALARELAPRLGTLHEQLLAQGRAVQIRTFHAWFGQLLAQAPLDVLRELGLPPAFEQIDDPEALRAPLLRRFHAAVLADRTLRATYVGLVRRHRRSVVESWLDAAWRKAAEIERADAAGTLVDAVVPPTALWPECTDLDDPAELVLRSPLRDEIAALAREFGAAKGKSARDSAAMLVDALQAEAAAAFDAAWRALYTQKDTLQTRLPPSPLLQSVGAHLERIREMRSQYEAQADHGAMVTLVRVLLAEWRQLKRQRGVVDMPDLERAAAALLGDSAVAGWVQERLDARVQQVLIDEFQDTSPLQWQALLGWLSSYAGAGGGASGQRPPTVFIVGDPKQSIYRFRDAEPRVFRAAREFMREGLQAQVLACDHTRRNAKAVLDVVNAVFGAAAGRGAFDGFRAHTTASTAAGRVEALPPVPREKTARATGRGVDLAWRDSLTEPRHARDEPLLVDEARLVAATVQRLIDHEGLAPGRIMVLARRRVVLAEVAGALAAAGIPHAAAEKLMLHEIPEVLDIAGLLDALLSPGDNLALARALRSPIFGAGDDDLAWLAGRAATSGRSWSQELLDGADPPSPALVRARERVPPWRRLLAELPPHDALDRIVHEGALHARLLAATPPARRAQVAQALQALPAAALRDRGGRFATTYGFVRALRAGRLDGHAVVPPAAVRLLTVHGAKGLEADAVIVADSHGGRAVSETAGVLVDWPVDDSAPRGVAFVRRPGSLPASLRALGEEAARLARREEYNALYVAMTRAGQRLVLTGVEPSAGPSRLSWWDLVQAQLPVASPADQARAASTPAADRGGAAPARVGLAQPTAPGTPSTDEVAVPALPLWSPGAGAAAPDAEPAASEASRTGEALHRALQWVSGATPPPPRAHWAAWCEAAAAAHGLPKAAGPRLLAGLAAIVDGAACRSFFDATLIAWAGNEVGIAYGGRLLRIDRLVAFDDPGDGRRHWWVLDYKLSLSPQRLDAYCEQLTRYVAAVAALQPADLVHGAFVTADGALVPLATVPASDPAAGI